MTSGALALICLEDAQPFVRREVAVMGSADVELRIKLRRFLNEVGEAVLGRAEEVVLDVGWRIPEAAIHELGTVNAVGHDCLPGGQVHAPSERHTVWDKVID
jgi:hypothetical protein